MIAALRRHWPEYLIEAWGLGLFMVSAGVFGTLIEASGSPVREAIPDPFVRRTLGGLAMGMTAIAIIYSPWGRRSGAHINPAVTLAFLRLRKIEPVDALFYVVSQFAGGVAGVLLLIPILGPSFSAPPVSYVATVPGPAGVSTALAAEVAISFLLMTMVLWTSNDPRFSRATGLFAGLLVASFIILESPYSGMSINPARTVASAWPSGVWTAGWLYFVAPLAGMLAAAEVFRIVRGRHAVRCAKYDHHGDQPCIFRCGYHQAPAPLVLETSVPLAASNG